MGYALCVIVMSHHAAAAVSVSAHELISIPPPPPLISLGHLEKVEREERKRKSGVSDGRARYVVRPPLLLWYANKAPGRHRNGDGRAAGRAQKQTTLSGIFEGSAGKMRLPVFLSSNASPSPPSSPLTLQLCGKERRHSLSLSYSTISVHSCMAAARLLFHGLHKSWTSASSFRVNVVF